MRHILSILLQNESGALARVASMFASRGFNIESLSVAPTTNEAVSRLTLVVMGDEAMIAQVSKQLGKLIDVVAIADRTAVDHIARELAIIKLRIPAHAIDSVTRLTSRYGVEVLDGSPEHYTLQLTGEGRDVDDFLVALPEEVRVLTIARSGPVVVARGMESLEDLAGA